MRARGDVDAEAAIVSAERSTWAWRLGALVALGFARIVGAPVVTDERATEPARTNRRRETTTDVAALVRQLDAPEAGAQFDVDALTSLRTRTDLTRLVRRLSDDVTAADLAICVLRIDLDDFGAVNRRLGRGAGDAVLREASVRMRGAARGDDPVMRMGGDEFIVLAPCVAGRADATIDAITTRVFAAMQAPLATGEFSGIVLGASIGTARWRPDGPPLGETVAQAGEALLAAKHAGRGLLRHYASHRAGRARRPGEATTEPR